LLTRQLGVDEFADFWVFGLQAGHEGSVAEATNYEKGYEYTNYE
jgi:hypothetical protein